MMILLKHLLIYGLSCVLLTLSSGLAESWIKYDNTGYCYQIVDERTTCLEALNICTQNGGMLTDSFDEQQLIQGHINTTYFKVTGLWIGTHYLHSTRTPSNISGGNVTTTIRAPSEYNNSKSRDNCAVICTHDQKELWNNTVCTNDTGYICEYTLPPQPNVTILRKSTQSIYIILTKNKGFGTRYQLNGTTISRAEIYVQNGTFPTSGNMTVHNFTTTDQPGTCFNFTIFVISGFGEGACTSDEIKSDDVCFDPSKPNVTFVKGSFQSIQVRITEGEGKTTSYEITGTPASGGNVSIQSGKYLSNQTSIEHNFTTSDQPGTCFNFLFVAISGAGKGAGRSETVVWNDTCYDPSKPNVTFVNGSVQGILVRITKGHGQATSYEITSTPVSGGNESKQNGTFLSNHTSVQHNFTTSDLPGTCFNIQFVTISGAGKGFGRSEALMWNDTCYGLKSVHGILKSDDGSESDNLAIFWLKISNPPPGKRRFAADKCFVIHQQDETIKSKR